MLRFATLTIFGILARMRLVVGFEAYVYCVGCAFVDVDNELIAETLINSLHGKVRLGNVSLQPLPYETQHPDFLNVSYAQGSHRKSSREMNHPFSSPVPVTNPSSTLLFSPHVLSASSSYLQSQLTSTDPFSDSLSRPDVFPPYSLYFPEEEPFDPVFAATKSQPVSRDALQRPSTSFINDSFQSMLSESISAILASQPSYRPAVPSACAPRMFSAEPILEEASGRLASPTHRALTRREESFSIPQSIPVRSVSPLPIGRIPAVPRSESPFPSADDWLSVSGKRFSFPSEGGVFSDCTVDCSSLGGGVLNPRPTLAAGKKEKKQPEKAKKAGSKASRLLDYSQPQEEGKSGGRAGQ